MKPYRFASFLALAVAILAFADAASDWKAGLLAWRTHREQRLSAPDGWLTLVGLEWLKPGPNTVGSAPDNRIRLSAAAPAHLGVIEVNGSDVRLAPPQGGFPSGVQLDGAPAQAAKLADDEAHNPSKLTAGTLTILLLHRGDRYALRIKDSQASTRLSFHGLHWYDPDPRYRVEATWIPFVPVKKIPVPSIIGVTDEMPTPGVAEFTLDGKTQQLEPVLEKPDAKQLFFILRDATSRSTSYGAARFLYTDFPDHGLDQPGHLVLDFNRLQNPPCAYTAYATCPLPPEQNRLAVALPVGEAKYSH
ncbi:MAG: DUF1684 domain-containing protein [Silvibacterium sp.]|nr:DUF1684 domain-containing protein [Silvibacterium sp.]MBV8436968.1 DUF1684 domain-containing protein [Silvibacterium sp.]